MEATTVIKDGQSECGLLWKSDEVCFPDNRNMAMKRLVSLERRMSKDSQLAKNMNEHLASYEEKNYIRKLSKETVLLNDKLKWYIPIFPVFDPKKPEKFRIVWDAAAQVD